MCVLLDIEYTVVSSPDLVLAVRGQKKGGGGEGKGEEEGPESGPRVNCACSKSDLLSCVHTYIEFDITLRFALKNAVL